MKLLGIKFKCNDDPDVFTIYRQERNGYVWIRWEQEEIGVEYDSKIVEHHFENGNWTIIHSFKEYYEAI